VAERCFVLFYLTPDPSPTLPRSYPGEGRLSQIVAAEKNVSMLDNESKRQRFGRKIHFARMLRKRMTSAEEILWKSLRNRKCADLKFRRQVPMGMFIADFLCRERRLIIEVDGGIHRGTRHYDHEKDIDQMVHGYQVLRFSNDQIQRNLKSVLDEIIKAIPSPGRQMGGVGEGKG